MHKKLQFFKYLRLGGVKTTNAVGTTMYEMEKSTGKPHLLYTMRLFCFSHFLDPHSSWSNSA